MSESRPSSAPPPQRKTSPVLVAMIVGVLALLGGGLAFTTYGWVTAQSETEAETRSAESVQSELGIAHAQLEDARAELADAQARLEASEVGRVSLQTENASLEEDVDLLQREVVDLRARVRSLRKLDGCMDAIIASYNATTYEADFAAAFGNTVDGPACRGVIESTPR